MNYTAVGCASAGSAPSCRISVWRERATRVDTQKAESMSAPEGGLPHVQPSASAPAAPTLRRHPLLVQGEAAIAKAGLILCCIVLLTTAASGWWTYQAQHEALM